ncbi:MAG: L-seryl-tRNA(Sec) selenium transferase [bacterium]
MTGDLSQKKALLESLPAVHEVLQWPGLVGDGQQRFPRWALRQAVQEVLDRQRREMLQGERTSTDPPPAIVRSVLAEAERLLRPSLRPLVNATGVVLHTNLGRAPLAPEALDAIERAARSYSNLELDLESGKRGVRYRHVERLLCDLTGAEAALVVNNNAAAVLLALRVLAQGREVVVSRGELVEIGGSFRIPDILRESGATLVEVGTTNRTHPRDYEKAIGPSTALLLKVHTSNYRILGFHREVPIEELVPLAARFSVPVMQDLGSGCLVNAGPAGPSGEPTVQQSVRAGVDVVTFSGDKLLGGPQAGILVGRREVLSRIRSHPMNRALRIDKLTLAALEATLGLYRDPSTVQGKVPALAMLSQEPAALKRKATNLARTLRRILPSTFEIGICEVAARAGGGALPLEDFPGAAVTVKGSLLKAEEILRRLRQAPVPVIARIEKDDVLLDPRTLLPGDEKALLDAFRWLAASL